MTFNINNDFDQNRFFFKNEIIGLDNTWTYKGELKECEKVYDLYTKSIINKKRQCAGAFKAITATFGSIGLSYLFPSMSVYIGSIGLVCLMPSISRRISQMWKNVIPEEKIKQVKVWSSNDVSRDEKQLMALLKENHLKSDPNNFIESRHELKELLKKGVRIPNAQTPHGGNLLHYLAKTGTAIALVKDLLEYGLSLDEQDFYYCNTPLMWAIANARNEGAMEFLKYPQNLNKISPRCKNAAIHLAVAKGYENISAYKEVLTVSNYQLVEKILEKGADVNIQDGDGDTPLHIAVLKRDIKMVKLLLRQHPNKRIRNSSGEEPLDMLKKTHQEVERILRKKALFFFLNSKEVFDTCSQPINELLA